MRHTLHIILALALLLVGCHSDPRQVELIDRAEAVMDSLPETALALLDSVDSHRLVRADNARYALLRSQALDKNFIDIANDSLIDIAVDYYTHSCHDHHYKMLAHYYHGRILYNAGDYARSIVALLKAEKEAVDNESHFYLGLIYRLFCYIYSDIYYNNGEVEYAQKSYEAFSKTDFSAHTDYALLEFAQSLYNDKDFNKCDSIITRLIESKTLSNDKHLSYLTYMLKSNLLINNKQYNEALATMSQLENTHGRLYSATDYINMSICHIANNDTANAYKYAHAAAQIDSTESWGLYLLNREIGDSAKALLYLEKEIELQNKLIQNISSQTVLWEVDEYKEQERIAAKHKAQRLLLTIILASTLLIAGVIATAIIRIKVVKAKMERSIAMAHNLKNTLFVKDKHIEALQSDVNKLFSGQFETLNKLCSIYYETGEEKKVIYAIYNDVKSTIQKLSSDKQTIKQLEDLANEHLDNIMVRFRDNYKSMSNDDIQLFLYIVMGFSSSAISVILNIDINRVYNRKASLKRKIKKNKDIDTAQFIHFFDK